MAAIVVVHGVGKQYLGPHTVHTTVAPALRDGLRLAGGPSIEPEAVEVAFYGHLFRPPGSPATKGEPAPTPRDLTHPLERELLYALWAEAARQAPDRVPPPTAGAGAKAVTPRSVQRALYALSQVLPARICDRYLVGVLQQVRRYLTEDPLRESVQRQVLDAVDADTRVLVAHSLGTVVAYETLCAHPDLPVRTLVTLGSPLGIPGIVFDRLRPPPRASRAAWPAGIRSWTNLCDRGDVVALRKRLAPLFGDPTGPTVTDVLVDNGWRTHELLHHLTAAATGAAVAAGLAE